MRDNIDRARVYKQSNIHINTEKGGYNFAEVGFGDSQTQ